MDAVFQECRTFKLDGLVVIGEAQTFTRAVQLADMLAKDSKKKTKVVAVPYGISGSLGKGWRSQDERLYSVGFDTASKIYSQLIGNLAIDSASAFKYWFIVRL